MPTMKTLAFLTIMTLVPVVSAQNLHRTIFDTEKRFEKMVAEKGIRDGFMEFLSPVAVMFMPDATNGREAWKARPASPASLTWNPIWIDVATNGALGYSIGNSQYLAKGKDDPAVVYGHYISVWMRQGDGTYKAELDTGINHDKPASEPSVWKSPLDSGKEANPDRISAADSSISFYQKSEEDGAASAYKSFLADDVIVLRQGKLPAFDKKAANLLLKDAPKIAFSKRKLFTEAADLGYVHGP
ncbi:MAG: nuclear transport factor 2 family protein, partial [Acidobacteriota bacterium]